MRYILKLLIGFIVYPTILLVAFIWDPPHVWRSTSLREAWDWVMGYIRDDERF